VSPASGGGRQSAVVAGILYACAASASFAVLDAIVKYLAQTYPSPLVAWVRYLFHVLVILVLLAPRWGRRLVATRRPLLQVVRGCCLAMSSLSFFAALAHLPQAEATAIISIGPILVTAVAVGILGERAPRGTWLAFALSFAGVMLIVRPGSELFSPAALLPLVAAVFGAGYTLSTRALAGQDDAVATLFIGGLVATVLLTGIAPLYWAPIRSWFHVGLFVAAGAIGAFGHLLLVRGYERANATTLAPFTYVHAVAALGCGWLVFGAFPDATALLGMGLIVATGVAMALARR